MSIGWTKKNEFKKHELWKWECRKNSKNAIKWQRCPFRISFVSNVHIQRAVTIFNSFFSLSSENYSYKLFTWYIKMHIFVTHREVQTKNHNIRQTRKWCENSGGHHHLCVSFFSAVKLAEDWNKHTPCPANSHCVFNSNGICMWQR